MSDSDQERTYITCPFLIPVSCFVWTHSRLTTTIFGTTDHSMLAVLTRGRRAPPQVQGTTQFKQLPVKLSTLAWEMGKKKMSTMSLKAVRWTTQMIQRFLFSPPSLQQSCSFLQRWLHQSYTSARLLWFVYTQRIKEKNFRTFIHSGIFLSLLDYH